MLTIQEAGYANQKTEDEDVLKAVLVDVKDWPTSQLSVDCYSDR